MEKGLKRTDLKVLDGEEQLPKHASSVQSHLIKLPTLYKQRIRMKPRQNSQQE